MAIGSIVGAAINSKASKKAAQQQAAAAGEANALQKEMFDINRADQMPFLKAGQAGNAQLSYLLGLNQSPYTVQNEQGEDVTVNPYDNINSGLGGFGSLSRSFTMNDYQADPGYAFRLSEGQKALNRAMNAKGKYFSGEAIKGLTDYNQNSASNEFMNAYNRFNTNQTNLYNRLAGISGTGQQSANQLNSLGQNYANTVGSNLMDIGNARAAGTVGSANAWSTGLNNAINNTAFAFGAPTGSGGLNAGFARNWFGG